MHHNLPRPAECGLAAVVTTNDRHASRENVMGSAIRAVFSILIVLAAPLTTTAPAQQQSSESNVVQKVHAAVEQLESSPSAVWDVASLARTHPDVVRRHRSRLIAIVEDFRIVEDSRNSDRLRCDTLKVLASLGAADANSVERIRNICQSGNFYIRAHAAVVLNAMEEESDDARSLVVERLGSNLAEERWLCAWAIGAILKGSNDVPRELAKLLDDPHPTVRVYAAQAVWQISGDAKRAVPVLIKSLDDDPEPAYLKPPFFADFEFSHTVMAALALAAIGADAAEAETVMMAQLHSDDGDDRSAALIALSKISQNPREIYQQIIDDSSIDAAIRRTANGHLQELNDDGLDVSGR